ncbi:class I SAM-dependent methyltransferase [Asaia sp. VD9]|uniref:class I SAM-dependent methyltransferase n=1 Tax=Asaia sp. VD9 TaxID=3081235 RepID=UPI00301B1FD0
MTDAASPHDTRIIDQFTRWASPFAALPLHAEAESMAHTIAACAVEPGMSVLDVACGPGIVACALAKEGGVVTGIDLTPAMIDQAQQRARQTGTTACFQIGNARALPFADGAFHRVVTRYSFHHMETPALCLQEMVRVCRPGGRVIVIDATPTPECRERYDEAEKLRDASHTRALTLAELEALGNEAGLSALMVHQYRLESQLTDQVAQEDLPALTAFFREEIASGQDRSGMRASEVDNVVRFTFPLSIVAWKKPAPL